MHRCECVVISLSYKCQCILICTYTVNEVNLNLFLVWPRSLEWTVDGCKKMDKLQKSFICRFGWKDFPSYYKYIHSHAIFYSQKGGRASIGYRASIGTYTVDSTRVWKHNFALVCQWARKSGMTLAPAIFPVTLECVYGPSVIQNWP